MCEKCNATQRYHTSRTRTPHRNKATRRCSTMTVLPTSDHNGQTRDAELVGEQGVLSQLVFFLGKGIIYRLVQQKNGPEAKSVLKIPAAPMRAHEELSMPPIHHV